MKKTAAFISLIASMCSFLLQGQQDPGNPLRRQVLYAPYREAYSSKSRKQLSKNVEKEEKQCVFCKEMQVKEDHKHFILARFKHNVVLLNLFPYQRGHVLIIPKAHVAKLSDLSEDARNELMFILAAIPNIFENVLSSGGANVGINLGSIAGASKPDHLHIHVVPRFPNDFHAFIEAVSETKIISFDLNKLYDLLKPAFDELKIQK